MTSISTPDVTAAAAAAVLQEALDAAVALDCGEVDRLHLSGLVVDLVVGGAASASLDLSTGPAAAPGREATVHLTPEEALAFARGRLALPGEVAAGHVAASGHVRELLEHEPIVRGLLADLAGERAARSADVDPARRQGGVAPPSCEILAVETRGLCKSFGPHAILTGADVRIPTGVISVILGPSGTGKSVFLKHVIGLLRPDAGEVLVRGRALSQMSHGEMLALRREIGVMFQDGALFSAMDVYENVAFPLRQHTDLEDDEIEQVVMERLSSVGLAHAARLLPNQLSGGMKKRAGLARSLVLEPAIVLVDEPDSGLDPVRTSLLGAMLVEQHSLYGGTMVIVTHNVLLAKNIADHMTVLWRGKVLEAGVTSAILASGTEFVQQFVNGETVGPLGMDA